MTPRRSSGPLTQLVLPLHTLPDAPTLPPAAVSASQTGLDHSLPAAGKSTIDREDMLACTQPPSWPHTLHARAALCCMCTHTRARAHPPTQSHTHCRDLGRARVEKYAVKYKLIETAKGLEGHEPKVMLVFQVCAQLRYMHVQPCICFCKHDPTCLCMCAWAFGTCNDCALAGSCRPCLCSEVCENSKTRIHTHTHTHHTRCMGQCQIINKDDAGVL